MNYNKLLSSLFKLGIRRSEYSRKLHYKKIIKMFDILKLKHVQLYYSQDVFKIHVIECPHCILTINKKISFSFTCSNLCMDNNYVITNINSTCGHCNY